MSTPWPDLGVLELLVAVAEHGSLSAAVRAAGMAQPNASRSISRLERHPGVTLLHRSTRGSTLTDSGVRVEVHVYNTHDVLDSLREGGCDVGFIEGPRPPRGVNHLTVAHDEMVLVAPRDHPGRGAAPR
ncbi:LysR family transcriptional regulator [Flexivirga oryzae]|uniref:DNA-binding transcriptional LysR family regulator n=1 Tax=Flexivirga oryzae TaxID=1794944 RepID=A0A839N103_9MICO|nr:LysR family transcriptional regulator [Flexivirga oryzae]MBB2891047.1 DNA-binding transcriptional LysR family regulator [Flexivirga oryzae]